MDVSEDVVGVVARGIYYAFREPLKGAPFFDQLPADARGFLRSQAMCGLERLRQNVTDGMVASVAELGLCRDEDAETIFVTMLDEAMKDHIQ